MPNNLPIASLNQEISKNYASLLKQCIDFLSKTLQDDTISDDIKNDILIAICKKRKVYSDSVIVKISDWEKTFILRWDRKLDPRYKEWRNKVFARDGYKCCKCNNNKYLEAHHLKSWRNFPQLRFDINNGQTLCLKHHKKTKNYGCKAINCEEENYAIC